MTDQNQALWTARPGTPLTLGPAPMPTAGPGEVVLRVHAIAVNPIDALPGMMSRIVLPWLRYPAVIGSDVAGEVVAVGTGVTQLAAGDRAVGYAVGIEKSRNRPAEGGFQRFVVLSENLVAAIPDALSYEDAAVLPMGVSTASSGLYESDQLGLALPTLGAADRDETLLVWGGSTSVGSNAIQLGRNSGYRVIATASPRNHDYVKSLGAVEAVDYRSSSAVDEIVGLLDGRTLAGTIAIGSGALGAAVAIARRTTGTKRIAYSMPGPATTLRAVLERRHGITITAIWGGALKDSRVGGAVYNDFLPSALASGAYTAAPPARVVGEGLEAIPAALAELKKGVSATKLVVRL